FAREVGVAHRPFQAAYRMLDEGVQSPAVVAVDRDLRGVFADAAGDGGCDPLAQCDDVGTRDDGIGKLAFAGLPDNDCSRAGVIDAELAFKSIARRFLAGQLQHQRMDAQFDSLDVLRLQAMRLRNLYATVDARMNDDAAGERLVRVVRDFEILSQAIGDRVPFPLRRI